MATQRLPMRKVREILRIKSEGRSHREVAASLQLSLGVVAKVLKRAETAGLSWPEAESLKNSELEEKLYGPPRKPGAQRPLPDPAYIHAERKKLGVTLELLHLEYLEQHPDGYRYTQFCEVYRRWLKQRGLSMRQIHRAGEKLFIDYSGKKPHIVDPKTGEVIDVELFVAVLGASNFTYAEATLTQQGHDFIDSHLRAFAYFEGAANILVPDQLKSGVTKACRYEPEIRRTYEDMAKHYGATVIPARPGKPKDKAKVEAGVLVAQRWILARLRNQTFFSLDELNERIGELLEELNDRHMKKYGASRRELFDRLDRPALKALPAEQFVYGKWKKAKVNIDYHIDVDGHYYSVHYTLRGEMVEAYITASTVEIIYNNERHTSHVRSSRRGHHTTKPEHMPESHRQHMEWSPSRFINWASKVGPSAEALVTAILKERPHPEQGYRSCLGVLRLAKRYSPERLEAACARAVMVRARSYRHVESILKNGLDRLPAVSTPSESQQPVDHENIRGANYYH